MGNSIKYVLVTAGRGPLECHWVVAKAFKVLLRELKAQGLNATVLNRVKSSEKDGLASVFIKVEGKDPAQVLSKWEGSLQWIGKSPYRKFHKRKNWFIGISVLDFQSQIRWDPSELEVKAFKASGPGGQHRNKVESAVRVTHLPSGLSVTCSESRSQHQNKKLALKRFGEAFAAHQLEVAKQQAEQQWAGHLNIERGNARKVFKGREFTPHMAGKP